MSERRDWDWERRRRIVRERGADPVDKAAPFPEWKPDEPTYSFAAKDQSLLDALVRGLRVSEEDVVRAAVLEDPCERRRKLCALLALLDKNEQLAVKLLRSHALGGSSTRERMMQRLAIGTARLRNAIQYYLDMPKYGQARRTSPSKTKHFPVTNPATSVTSAGPASGKHGPVVSRRLTEADRERLGLPGS